MPATGLIITPQQALEGTWRIIDVRSATERATACVRHSLHLPLQDVEAAHPILAETGQPIALLCKGGTRARLAQERLAACGVQAYMIEGGLDHWQREGLPVERLTASRWSLERQVRLMAGLLVLTGTAATALLNPHWLWLTGFVGAGLTFAGLTDLCLMGNLLARMPWNRIRSRA